MPKSSALLLPSRETVSCGSVMATEGPAEAFGGVWGSKDYGQRIILHSYQKRERERDTFPVDNKDSVIICKVSVVHNCQHKLIDGW